MIKILNSNKEFLLKKIIIVNNIIEKKKFFPILSNILIIKKKNIIYLLSSNIEIQIIIKILIGIDNKNISFTIESQKLLEILKSLPNFSKIKIFFKNNKIYIKSKNLKFKLQSIESKNFPLIKEEKKNIISFLIKQNKLNYLFNMVYFVISNTNIKYSLNGILFLIKKNKILVAATDTYRLVICKIKTNIFFKYKIIIPKKTILELQKLLNDKDDIKIKIFKNQIKLYFSGIKFISKISDENFPNYKKILSYNYKNKFIINRKILLNSLNRISIIINEKFKGIHFILKNNLLLITSINLLQEEVEEKIKINYKGIYIKIGFNINYLIDFLNNIKDNLIQFNFNNEKSAILITIFNNKNFKYIIMPMNI